MSDNAHEKSAEYTADLRADIKRAVEGGHAAHALVLIGILAEYVNIHRCNAAFYERQNRLLRYNLWTAIVALILYGVAFVVMATATAGGR